MYRLDSSVAITLPVDFDIEPDSSFIQRIAYDSANSRCYVTMHDTTYEYDNVPYQAFVDLWSASSVGYEYQNFRANYGPSTLTGKNIDFEIRNHTVADPYDDIFPATGEQPVTESDEVNPLEWSDSVNIRAIALEAAAKVPYSLANDVVDSARLFEKYLLEG